MSDTPDDQPTSRSAKILYRPVGIASSIAGGLVANAIFTRLWRRAAPGENTDPPSALDPSHRVGEILIASALQGAIFAATKTIIDRAGARAFKKWSGEWPGP